MRLLDEHRSHRGLGPHVNHSKVHGVQDVSGTVSGRRESLVSEQQAISVSGKALVREPPKSHFSGHRDFIERPHKLQFFSGLQTVVATQTQCRIVLVRALPRDPCGRLSYARRRGTRTSSSARMLVCVVRIERPTVFNCRVPPLSCKSSGPKAAQAKQGRNESDQEGKQRVDTYSHQSPSIQKHVHFVRMAVPANPCRMLSEALHAMPSCRDFGHLRFCTLRCRWAYARKVCCLHTATYPCNTDLKPLCAPSTLPLRQKEARVQRAPLRFLAAVNKARLPDRIGVRVRSGVHVQGHWRHGFAVGRLHHRVLCVCACHGVAAHQLVQLHPGHCVYLMCAAICSW